MQKLIQKKIIAVSSSETTRSLHANYANNSIFLDWFPPETTPEQSVKYFFTKLNNELHNQDEPGAVQSQPLHALDPTAEPMPMPESQPSEADGQGLSQYSRHIYQLAVACLTKQSSQLLIYRMLAETGKRQLNKKQLRAIRKLKTPSCFLCLDPKAKPIESHVVAKSFLEACGFESGVGYTRSGEDKPVKGSRHHFWTEPIFCKPCDGGPVGKLEERFLTDYIQVMNRGELPQNYQLPWNSGDHRFDGQSLFALGASLGLRAFHGDLYNHLYGLTHSTTAHNIDFPLLFRTFDRMRAIVNDPSCIGASENFQIFVNVAPSTRVATQRTPFGDYEEDPDFTRYMSSFHYFVRHMKNPSRDPEHVGFMGYLHFGRYTFVCTVNLIEADILGQFEGLTRVLPHQPTSLVPMPHPPVLIRQFAKEHPRPTYKDLSQINKAKMKQRFAPIVQAAKRKVCLPTSYSYDPNTCEVTLPSGHVELKDKRLSMDEGIGISYMAFCKTNTGKRYVIVHNLKQPDPGKTKWTIWVQKYTNPRKPFQTKQNKGIPWKLTKAFASALKNYLKGKK